MRKALKHVSVLKIKMVSYHTIDSKKWIGFSINAALVWIKRRTRIPKNIINVTAFNPIDNVHEKFARFWLAENDCILM